MSICPAGLQDVDLSCGSRIGGAAVGGRERGGTADRRHSTVRSGLVSAGPFEWAALFAGR